MRSRLRKLKRLNATKRLQRQRARPSQFRRPGNRANEGIGDAAVEASASDDATGRGRKRTRNSSKTVVSPAKAIVAAKGTKVKQSPTALAARDAFRALQNARKSVNGTQRSAESSAAWRQAAQNASMFSTAALAAARRLHAAAVKSGTRHSVDATTVVRANEQAHSKVLDVRKAGAGGKIEALHALIALDEAYHRLRYFVTLLGGDAEAAVSPPHSFYVSGSSGAWSQGLGYADSQTVAQFLAAEAGEAGTEVARSMLQLQEVGGEGAAPDNPLLVLLQARWRETVAQLWGMGLVPKSVHDCSPAPAREPATMKGEDPLASAIVRAWRDSVRVWACHTYSYAVPSEAALSVLKEQSPLVEVGAGTGYWAALLRARGAVVFAYDKEPLPTAAGEASSNEYHGSCRAWTRVLRGGPEACAKHPNAALLLCYPPPDAPMALDALRNFQGNVLCYVGEWHGDTGTAAFERELSQGFVLQRQVPLPNWGDTSASLMVWERSARAVELANRDFPRSPLACWACGCRGDANLWRCRLSYDATFCSASCAKKRSASARHQASLALKMGLTCPMARLPTFGGYTYRCCSATASSRQSKR